MLCANAQLNNVSNLHALCCGVGRQHAIGYTPRGASALQGNIGNFSLQHLSEGERVEINALDGFDFPGIKLINIDVEGMEKEVIEGAKELIMRDRPILFVENNISENSLPLISILWSLGYSCYWHISGYYRSDNFYGSHQDIFANVDRPEINMICFPGEVPSWLDEALRVLHPRDGWIEALNRQTGL